MLEIEGTRWIGAFKFTGKENYANEGMRRMDTMYVTNMTDVHREMLRINRFSNMGKALGHTMSPYDLNKKLMLWNKRCPCLLSFTNKCARLNILLLMHKYGYAMFGKGYL